MTEPTAADAYQAARAAEDAYDAAVEAAYAARDALSKPPTPTSKPSTSPLRNLPPLSYVSLHLTCPIDGPAATVSIYDQWLAGSKPKVLIQGRPGDGSFVEFVGDADTVASLREAADVVESLIERGVESA